MKKNMAFTIFELLVVLIIIGVLSTLAITQYTSSRERVLDKEAIVALKLMQQAQKVYWMDENAYYPMGGSASETDIAAINKDLKLFLNEGSWDYLTYSTGTSTATRSSRSWTLTINASNSTCAGSCL